MQYRNPAHTGRNRCWPCTIVNLGLAALGVGVIAKTSHPIIAGIAAIMGVVAVGFRGYLIPGTPRLTRKLPEPILSRLEKAESPTKLPTGERLISSGVLNDDLSLSAQTADRVCERTQTLIADSEVLKEAAVDAFPGAVEASVRRSLSGGENWFIHDVDEMSIRQWKARPIAAIDTANAEYLSTILPDWEDLQSRERRTMLSLLRYGVPNCPSCEKTFSEPDGPDVTCCGGRSLVGKRRCERCEYALVDHNDLPSKERDA
ncbi:hypothetical protein [Haladaptatus caseinilyticus]|uniref:hypothetical protein n=1 Tax=Haladaptatus caseinilyticus TaxID=2993314 RepID=UPI00224B2556|nr:hypothetical protein [Haladaptatus caseinilyticus]